MQKALKILIVSIFLISLKVISVTTQERITATGQASGAVASDSISIFFDINGLGYSENDAKAYFYRNLKSLRDDVKKLGVNNFPIEKLTVKKTGKQGDKDIYTATAKSRIDLSNLKSAKQVSDRLDQQRKFVKNKYVYYKYTDKKVHGEIERLIENAILQADENALKQIKGTGKYISRILDSKINIDMQATSMTYVSKEVRARYANQKGYKYINLSVTIVYEVKKFDSKTGDAESASKKTLVNERKNIKSKLKSDALKRN